MDSRKEDFSDRVIVIRSDKCTASNSDHECSFVLPRPIVPDHGSVLMLQLVKFSFAHSFYLVDDFHDKLVISNVEYTIEHGNYNGATMMTYLRTLLPIQVDYTPKTFKFTFSHSSAFSVGSASTCLTILGIKTSQCDSLTTLLTGHMAADLHGHHALKMITNLTINSMDSSVGDDPHLLARIPVEMDMHDKSTFAYEHYRPSHKMRYLVREKALSEIRVKILDQENHPIHFNCIPYSVKFIVSIIKQEKMLSMSEYHATSTGSPYGEAVVETGPSDGDEAASEAGKPRPRRAQTRRKKDRRRRKA